MELEAEILERVRTYEWLSRWEKSELGRELRRLGLSYGEIMELIPVKKSTLATWCRDVELTDAQIEGIKERRPPPSRRRVAGLRRNTQWKRHEEIEVLRRIARAESLALIDDPEWVAGLVLYWAEGNKTESRVGMANADPRALRLFVGWIRRFVNPKAEFTLHLHLHEGNDENAAQRHWTAETGLHDSRFIKTFIKPKGTGHRKNHLEHGVCTVRLKRPADAWNVIMEWIDCLADHFDLQNAPN